MCCYCCLVTKLYSTLCDSMDCSTPGFSVLQYFPELAQTHVHWVGDAIQPSHSLSLPSPLAFNLSLPQGLFQWVISSHQVAKVLDFYFSISSFSEYSGLTSFRIDWLDLLAVQGTLKSLLQHRMEGMNLYIWENPTWSWCIIFTNCWIQFVNILLRIFASIYIRGNGVYFLFQ